MPLDRPVRYFSQNAGEDGPLVDDPTGCWYACAQMLRVYFGGPVTPAQDVLVNTDGTHRSLGGQAVGVFLKNEHLTALATKLDSPEVIDATLTNYGPIIFYWHAPQGFHASVIIAVLGRDIVYHDPAIGPGQRMSMDAFQLKTAAGLNGKGSNHIRDPNLRSASSPRTELVLASDGVTKKYPLPWPTGWWRVWDGGTWYYTSPTGVSRCRAGRHHRRRPVPRRPKKKNA